MELLEERRRSRMTSVGKVDEVKKDGWELQGEQEE